MADYECKRKRTLRLFDLPSGREAQVILVDRTLDGFQRRRLLDLGLTPGARVCPEFCSSFGDPRAYRVRGVLIALRRRQAASVWVQILEEGG